MAISGAAIGAGPGQRFRAGNNTQITVVDGLVRKVSRHVFPADVAATLAGELIEYAAALDGEPVDVPAIEAVSVIPDRSGGSRIGHVTRVCTGPNLCALHGDALMVATRTVLGQIARMSTIDANGTLRVPFDAAANNFHIERERGILVDLFPPLLRRPDGALPMENIPFSVSWARRRLIPYTRGTREGALLSTLFTAMTGDRPMNQAWRIARGIEDWCYDVLPPALPARERDALRRQIAQRFVPHFLRNTVSDGDCGMRKLFGVRPYGGRRH